MNWPLYRDLKADVLFEFNRFPELSRISGICPGLPGFPGPVQALVPKASWNSIFCLEF